MRSSVIAGTVGTLISSPVSSKKHKYSESKSPDEVEHVKGDRSSPVSMDDIRGVQNSVLTRTTHSVSTQSSSEIVLSDPGVEQGYIAGYAIKMNNGTPTELIEKVSDPLDFSEVSESDTDYIRTYSEDPSDEDAVSSAHNRLDNFVNEGEASTSVSGSGSPPGDKEPPWERLGNIQVHSEARFNHPKSNERISGGLSELATSVFKVTDDNRFGENQYACAAHNRMWPGIVFDGAHDKFKNHRAKIKQNWKDNEAGGLELGEWGPRQPAQGSIDLSFSVGASGRTPGGTVNIDPEEVRVDRDVESDYNETVEHEYSYPYKNWCYGCNHTSSNERVEHANLAEAWLNNPTEYDTLLNLETYGRFKGEFKFDKGGGGCGAIGWCERETVKPWTYNSVDITKNRLEEG